MQTSLKTCFKCGVEKPLTEFYKHKAMADGHLNKCKSCAKIDVIKHREENIDKIRQYDRDRGNRQSDTYLSEYREKYPKKYIAHTIINNALRDGKLFKQSCEICNFDKSVAHHDDYDKPLEIRWLCQAHHKQWHAVNGEGLNGS